MKTRKKTVEIEEQYWELTRPDLEQLRNLIRGGNATNDNVQLMRYAADLIPEGKHDEIRRALKERAGLIEHAISEIDRMLSR